MQLRDYQQAAHDLLWVDLCTQSGNPLIVAPTGAGKSPLIGAICETAYCKHGGRAIVLAHRQELLVQNSQKIKAFLPDSVSVGVYSAGLKRYATDDPVICAGIQSVAKKASLFGERKLVIIDEAHLVPDDDESQYQTFLSDLREINPTMRIVGLTATPFRTGTGEIIGPNKIFQRIAHETPVKQLIDAGWLCPLVSQPGDASIETRGVHIRAGEFITNELERLFSNVVTQACREIVAKTVSRHSVLVFCQTVAHAEQVHDCLERLTNEKIGIVTGGTSPIMRESALQAFRNQSIRFLVNVDVLTTGFDAPCIDAIAVLRATMSPGLFAQIVGRGLRLDPSKTDCLVLDFGQNVDRHGQLDDPEYGHKTKKKGRGGSGGESDGDDEGGEAEDGATAICPNCGEPKTPGAKECLCGFLFPEPPPKHEGTASGKPLIGYQEKTQPEWFAVEQTGYAIHKKRNADGPDTLRVDYYCRRENGNLPERISEWVCFDHEGYARQKANSWWLPRCLGYPPAETVQEAYEAGKAGELKEPTRIKAHRDGKFWKIDLMELSDYAPNDLPDSEKHDSEDIESLLVWNDRKESDDFDF